MPHLALQSKGSASDILSATTNNLKLQNQKQVNRNETVKFGSVLATQNQPKLVLPNFIGIRTAVPDEKLADVSLLKLDEASVEKLQKELIDFAIKSQNEAKQQEAEMVKQEAEMVKKDAETTKLVTEFGSPEYQKKYLMSVKVEAVVRDKQGNIIAQVYMPDDGGKLPREAIELLQKYENDPNMIVTHYKNLTEFDLVAEKMALTEKEWIKRPELYDPKMIIEAREFHKRLLAA